MEAWLYKKKVIAFTGCLLDWVVYQILRAGLWGQHYCMGGVAAPISLLSRGRG